MATDPIVSIKSGQLRGRIATDWKGGLFYSFQGIPYGRPPIGKLRFKVAQPAEPWSGIRDATQEGDSSYSRNYFKLIVGSEDCLYLNVYTPKLPNGDSTELKSVMLWIHGGGFNSGSGNSDTYGPDYLVAEDVVLVTINYRLGLLGFASFEDPSLEIPGNAGLKDQVLALKWVQENIVKFSGNPKNVTIFGESAGGSSVHSLMLSPLATGLFHRAIAQSGVASCLWALGQRTGPLVAKALKLGNNNEKEIVNRLLDLPVQELFKVQEEIPDLFMICSLRPFGIVVESYCDENTFLSEDPIKIMKSGKFNQVPLMIGYTSREGMLLHSQFKNQAGNMIWNCDFEDTVPFDLNLLRESELSKTVAQKIKQFYYGNEKPSCENIQPYYLLQSDNFFFLKINQAVQYHSFSSSSPIYYYRISADTKLNVYKCFYGLKEPGTSHGDDLGYLFKNLLEIDIRPRSQEGILLQQFLKLWTTFTKYGYPNPVQKHSLIDIVWPPVNKNQLCFLDIGENLTVGNNPEAVRVEFWNEIYDINYTKSNL